MPSPPVTVNDTVIYLPRNFFGDKDISVRMIDGSILELWGPVYVNGSLVVDTAIGIPIASNAEALAGTDNTKVMTPLRVREASNALYLPLAGGTVTGALNVNGYLKAMGQFRAYGDAIIGGNVTVEYGGYVEVSDSVYSYKDEWDIDTNEYRLVTRKYVDDLMAGVGGGVTDGDKGEITITGGIWTIDNLVVTAAKIANDTITATQIAADAIGSSELANNAVDSAAIAASAVTNIKLANMNNFTLKGNNTGSPAPPTDLIAADVKSLLALNNVTNTSDANKPVSTAQQTALDLKAPLASPTFTGTVTVPYEVYGAGWNGSNTVPTKDAVYDKIETIVAGGGGLTQEQAEDAVAAMFAAGTHTNATVTYNDTTPSLSIAASGGGGGLPPDATYRDIVVTGSGTLWDLVADCVTTSIILNGNVTNAKLANTNQYTIKGRIAAGSGAPTDLTPANVRTVISSDSGGGTTYLKADGNWTAVTKSDVGLGNVDNTSDANAPVSTAQQTALDLKANISRTINTYSGTSLTGVIGDAGAYLRCTGSNPTYTLPPNASVSFPVGTQIDGVGTATAMTLVAGGGVTVNKSRTLVTVAADSGWTAIKVATDEWDVHGDFV